MLFRDYCDMEVPAGLLEAGLEDTSWHNDAAARMTARLDGVHTLTLWVAEEDPADREMPYPRFVLILQTNTGDHDHTLVATDSLVEVLSRIESIMARDWNDTGEEEGYTPPEV